MKGLLLDIDGTTLLGEAPLPGAPELVAWLREQAVPFLWVTNNTSRSRAAWLTRLGRAGLAPEPAQVYTAGDATIDVLVGASPRPRVFLVGTDGLADDFRAARLELVGPDDDPDVLVLGYDTTLDYGKIAAAARVLRRGTRFVATHPDRNCPSPEGPLPDVGSFLAMFETSTGRRPEVIGKPNAVMATSALARLGVAPADAAMVGDRLETDVRMANDGGLASILVLTGATSAEAAKAAPDRPTHVCADLHDVLSLVRCQAHRKE